MRPYLKRALVLVTGWASIVVGVIGLFLPFLQGVLFLLIGLVILSTEYVWAHHLLSRLRQRFPKLGSLADQATAKANRWMQRLFRHHGDN
jgi:uncharacterized protein